MARLRSPFYVGSMRLARALLPLLLLLPAACGKTDTASNAQSSKSGTSVAEPPPAGGEVARPAAAELAPFKIGQWSKYRINMDDGTSTEVTYKVVAEEGGAYWLEIVRGAADAGTVMQLLINVTSRTDPSSLEIRAARIRMPNNQIRELRDEMLKPTAEGYKRALSDIFAPSLTGAEQEDVTVPAATFRGAYKRIQKIETAKANSEQTVWLHPAVPISGVVKSEEIGKPNRTELLTWGATGAKSEMQREKKEP